MRAVLRLATPAYTPLLPNCLRWCGTASVETAKHDDDDDNHLLRNPRDR